MLYQLTKLLHQGLAQHILIELYQRWNPSLEEFVKNNQDNVRNDIVTLMRADVVNKDSVCSAIGKKRIGEMLNAFAVGTEESKLAIPKQPHPNELVPLQYLKLYSLPTKAKEIYDTHKIDRV